MGKSVSVAVTAVLALAELLAGAVAGAVADEVADGVAGVGLELLLPLEPHPARVSAAARFRFFFIELNPSGPVIGQKRAVGRSYSTWNTALPARTNGASESHSSYCTHCSLTAKSNAGCSSPTWSRSFLRPTASPRW